MSNTEEPLETLKEIRSLMLRSTKFISLSGLSGIFAGVFALLGAGFAQLYLGLWMDGNRRYYDYALDEQGGLATHFIVFFIIDAFLVILLSVIFSIYFTIHKARKKGLPIWDASAFRFLESLLIPLFSGGLFCLILLYHHLIGLIAPSMLVFYGLTLINASKYTLHDIWYLGILEILLGLISAVFIGYGLLFWAIGFGLLHILYGSLMYYKYER